MCTIRIQKLGNSTFLQLIPAQAWGVSLMVLFQQASMVDYDDDHQFFHHVNGVDLGPDV